MRSKMKKSLTAAALIISIVLTATMAQAGGYKHTQKGYFAATTEQNFNLGSQVLRSKDRAAFKRLLATGRIFILKAGVPVQITEVRWAGLVKFRPAGSFVEFWTFSEAIK